MNKDEIIKKLNQIKSLTDECLNSLLPGFKIEVSLHQSDSSESASTKLSLDFTLSARPFIKRYGGKLNNGQKRFVLLLAFITHGEVGKEVPLTIIQTEWKKMTAANLMGNFNAKYPTEAKTEAWVDSKNVGTYCLREDWIKIFG